MNGAVDVSQGAVTQAVGVGVIFLACDVGTCLAQELHGLVNAAAIVRVCVHRRAGIRILAVVVGRSLISAIAASIC